MLSTDHLQLNPDMPHHVVVAIDGYMMSEEAQDQRDALAEWFLRSGVEEEDMDSVYTNLETTETRWKRQATHMVFAFKDAQKATLFKLAWG